MMSFPAPPALSTGSIPVALLSYIRLTEDGYSRSPCFIYGQECPCSVVGHAFKWRMGMYDLQAFSTGRFPRALLSDIRLTGEGYPRLPCFIYRQDSPCSVVGDSFN